MSTRSTRRSLGRRNRSEALTLRGLCAGLALAVFASSALFFGLGIDLLRHAEHGIPCVIHLITGLECPGCGMTRALVLVSQLDWSAAWRMNAMVFPLLGGALWKLRDVRLLRVMPTS